MKKFLIGMCGIAFLFGGVSSAITLESFTSAIDKQVEKQTSLATKISFLEGLKSLLETPTFVHSEYAQMFAELANYSYQRIQALKSQPSATSRPTREVKKSDGSSYISIGNVDVQRVRETVLGWHNTERSTVNVAPYRYHSDLEKSATTWAEVLREGERTSNTHSRNSSDGYYNYESITHRFEGLGIFFPSAGNGKAAFSESVGWGYYKCSSTDCTEALIQQLKTTRDFFMSEKNSNGSHYKAITMGHFTQMGIGISIDSAKKRYYLVIHYGMDILE